MIDINKIQQDFLLKKGKSVPVGTVTGNYKKVSEGKWQKVKKDGDNNITKNDKIELKKRNKDIASRFDKLTKDQFKSCKRTFVGFGAGAMYSGDFTDKNEALAASKLWGSATGAESKLDKVYEDIDIFDKDGELIDVKKGDFLHYNVTTYFGK
jgi:hypothetical protein